MGRFLEREVPVLNDAHAALLGEVWQGAAKGARDAILLTLGTGVGGAILSDGRLLKGSFGRAGHLGHVSVTEGTERSIFGMPGSLEAAFGNYTVPARSNGRFASTRALVEAHCAGDAEATAVWQKSLRTLARAIASFINILDPEIVIIGGGITKAGPILFEPLAGYLDDIEWRPAGRRVSVVPARLGEWAGAYGAAWNALPGLRNETRAGSSRIVAGCPEEARPLEQCAKCCSSRASALQNELQDRLSLVHILAPARDPPIHHQSMIPIHLVANGDLRIEANQKCEAAQAAMEKQLIAASKRKVQA